MSEQYLVDAHATTIDGVVDSDTYQERVRAREELQRLRAAHASQTEHAGSSTKQQSIRELRGLGKATWAGIDIQHYIREERDSWDE